MEVKPKISRYLILIVFLIFVILALVIYGLVSSEKLTKYAIVTALEKQIPADKLNIKVYKIEGCLLNGIKIDRIDLKHIKPNFEASIENISINPSFDNIFANASIVLNANIENIVSSGTLKLNPTIASIPAFLGYECMAAIPSNITINKFSINKIKSYPCGNKDLEIISNSFELSNINKKDFIDVSTDLNLNWKNNLLAKASYKGSFEQKKTRLNGNLKIDFAKQIIVSELSLAKGKKGMEISGYIASDTLIDFQPLSQWLGCFWQLDYPYAISGKLFCQGSWLYNSEVGFLGNIKGRYEKLNVSILGLFFSLLELNGDWQLFDGALTLTDKGSKLIGFPASLNGKIESVATSSRKANLTFNSNSLPLDKLTSSLPWMVKYSNGIPDLAGIATLTVNLLGNRPTINAKAEFTNLSQISINNPKVNIQGKAIYTLPEIGSGSINANFTANSNNGLPIFFKRFNKNFYDLENKIGKDTTYNYLLSGSLNHNLKIKGSLTVDNNNFETSGEQIEDKFNLIITTNENKNFNSRNVELLDLILMR